MVMWGGGTHALEAADWHNDTAHAPRQVGSVWVAARSNISITKDRLGESAYPRPLF